jgi:hypothetical protein
MRYPDNQPPGTGFRLHRAAFILLASALVTLGCVEGVKGTQKYTCPMHPEVISDKPGKCPKCEMPLEPMGSPAKSQGMAGSGSAHSGSSR